VTLDDSGRRAASVLRRAAERIGLVPDPAVVRRRRWRCGVARNAFTLTVTVLTVALAWQGLPTLTRSSSHMSLRGLDSRVVAAIDVGERGRLDADNVTPLVAADAHGVWVLDSSNRAVLAIDPARNLVAKRIGISLGPAWEPKGIWALGGAAWVLSVSKARGATMQRIDTASGGVAATYKLPGSSFRSPPDLVTVDGSLWLSSDSGTLRIDQRSARAQALPDAGTGKARLAVAAGRVWASSELGTVEGIDPGSGEVVDRIGQAESSAISDVAGDGGSLWILSRGGALERVALPSGQVQASFPLGDDFGTNPIAMVAAGGTLAAIGPKALYIVDAFVDQVRAEVRLNAPGSVAVGAGAVWVADPYHGVLLRIDPGA
jgi:hypothetical protein